MKLVAKTLILLALLLIAVVPITAAQDDMTIVGVARNDGRFTTLVAAVEAANLGDALSGGEWTIFAPTDAAFAKLGLNANNIGAKYSSAELADLILYHALREGVSTAEAKTKLGDITMANGRLAGLKWFDDSIWVNDDSRVITRDIQAANGVIHAVDTVIQAPWPREAAEPQVETVAEVTSDEEAANTIFALLDNHRKFDTISAAIKAAGLEEAFSSGEWTLFAPDDSSFKELGLTPKNIAQKYSKAELVDLVLYHALTEEVNIDKARTMLGDVTMANDRIAGLKVFKRTLWVNDDAKVTGRDVRASNGIIHVVDHVILPPWPRVDEEIPQAEGQ